jgi:TrmH family RNA methyltransferase
MTSIRSPQNPRLKALRRLHSKRERERTAMFIAEGEDLLAAAELAGRPALEGYRLAGSAYGGEGFLDVDAAALAHASTLGSGTRVIAVFAQRWGAPAGPLCVYLHGVGDPGNVGTVLRAAHAFGAASVALGPGCADPHSPKAVRASMGAVFAVALARVDDPRALPGARVALDAHAGEPLGGVLDDVHTPLTLLVGAEREGLPADVLAGCDRSARIPIAGDSLNAAMAATVALYEVSRRLGVPGGAAAAARRSSRVPAS